MKMRLVLGLVLAFAFPALGQAATSLPEQMKLLIEQRRAAEAYSLGLPATDQIGEPLYDYYFGIAAVDAGHTFLGVMALERFLLADPSNNLARLELGRAYFKLGDYVRARQEFKVVLAAGPPSSVQATINKFLSAMENPNKTEKSAFGAFVEVAGGATSNANSGISGSAIDLPGFGTVTLADSGIRQSSGLAFLSAGSFASIPVTKGLRAIGSVSGYYRAFSNVPAFDMANFNASAGIGPVSDKLSATISATYGHSMLNGLSYRENYGAMANVRKSLGKLTVITLDGGFQRLRYKGLNKNRNGVLYTVSAGLDQKLKAPGSPVVSVTGYLAQERNHQGRDDFSRNIVGGRLAVTAIIAPKLTLLSAAGLARWRYIGPDLLFGTVRRDWYKSAEIAAQFELSKGLTMRFEGQYAKDSSSIPLYRFAQKQMAIVLRREWQ
ncbi:MAG: hypothetical protein RL425_895 [Pseudomonadota bacterium]|jgi:tetratricopeptide (TPR) repeat protein